MWIPGELDNPSGFPTAISVSDITTWHAGKTIDISIWAATRQLLPLGLRSRLAPDVVAEADMVGCCACVAGASGRS